MSALAHAGYNQTKKLTATPRQIEAQIFSRIAADMEMAAKTGEGALHMPALARAIHDNNQLWSALMADLAAEGNELPEELKANLISLGGFSLRHGAKVLSGDAEVTELVELNRSISAGLRGVTAEAA